MARSATATADSDQPVVAAQQQPLALVAKRPRVDPGRVQRAAHQTEIDRAVADPGVISADDLTAVVMAISGSASLRAWTSCGAVS